MKTCFQVLLFVCGAFLGSCDFIDPDFDPEQEIEERPSVFHLWGRAYTGTTEQGQEVVVREYLDFSLGQIGSRFHFRAQGAQNESTIIIALYLIPGEKQGKEDEWDHHYRFDGSPDTGVIFNIERNAVSLRYTIIETGLRLCPPVDPDVPDDPSQCTEFIRAD